MTELINFGSRAARISVVESTTERAVADFGEIIQNNVVFQISSGDYSSRWLIRLIQLKLKGVDREEATG